MPAWVQPVTASGEGPSVTLISLITSSATSFHCNACTHELPGNHPFVIQKTFIERRIMTYTCYCPSYARQFTPPSRTTSKNSYTSISLVLFKATLNSVLSTYFISFFNFRQHIDLRNLPYHSVIFAFWAVIWALITLLYPTSSSFRRSISESQTPPQWTQGFSSYD